MITIDIETIYGIINIKWNDEEKIRHYDFNQSARYVYPLQKDVIESKNLEFTEWQKLASQKIKTQLGYLTDNCLVKEILSGRNTKVLSVGSGTSTLEVLLSMINPNITFYLVDKNEFNLNFDSPVFTDNRTNDKTIFQNSWEPFEDAIKSNRLDRSKFILLDPSNPWPTDIDLIYSFASWGWHYNSPTYIQRLSALKKNGCVMLLVLLLQNNIDLFINEISTIVGSSPDVKYINFPSTERSKLQFGDVSQKGGIFSWKKSRT